MSVTRQRLLEILEDSYTAYYNIIKEDLPSELPIVFRADYFKRTESYWLSKSITIYGNEENEYAYVFSAPEFSQEVIEKCFEYALSDGLPRVKPHKEHQVTNIKAVFVADSFEDGALKAVQKKKFSKSYHLSLWGYTDLLACAVIPESEEVYTNRAGQAQAAYFKKLLSAEAKNQKKLSAVDR